MSEVVLAIDAMGGDQGPKMVIKGLDLVRKRYPNVRYKLFGDTDILSKLLKKFPKLKSLSEVFHSESVIPNDMKPSVALRREKQSSLRLAVDAVKKGEADGVVSAGNTGALMAISQFVLKSLPGVHRPAIAGIVPSQVGESVMLDLGANLEKREDHFVQFSYMGALFAQKILGVVSPKIGLLNVGEEDGKGNEILQATNKVLKAEKLPGTYCGFVEGHDIAEGTVDVIVTDGFTGNIALKVYEGAARLVNEYIRQAFRNSFMALIGAFFAKNTLRKLKVRTDPRLYNGAVLLGVNGVIVKSHGGTDSVGFASALEMAIDMVQQKYNQHLEQGLEKA